MAVPPNRDGSREWFSTLPPFTQDFIAWLLDHDPACARRLIAALDDVTTKESARDRPA